MYDDPQIAEMVSAVRRVAISDRVLQVEEHFAGYFDELGITVSVESDTSDDDIRDLKNRIAPQLARFDMPFKWVVLFQRDGELAAVLFPDGQFTGPAESPRVAVVLDPTNEQLEATANSMPVWAVDSPGNRSIAQRFWSKFPNARQRDIGITLFETADVDDRYNNFVGVLNSVDEHHWDLHLLYVFGLELTDRARADLQKLGFDSYSTTADGFIATRAG